MTGRRPGHGAAFPAIAVAILLACPGTPARGADRVDAPADVAAQTGATREADAPLDWHQIGRDAKYVFGRPANLDTAGWVRLGAGVGTGAALYLVRDEARDFALEHGGERWDSVLDGARLMGRLATPLLAAGAFSLAGAVRDSGHDRETAVVLLESLTYASFIAGVTNQVIATERPRDGDDVKLFGGNGHAVSIDVTIAASMLAPVIDRHLRIDPDDTRPVRFWKRFGAWGMYGTAGLTALQRMNEDAHWLPDVYLGYLNGLCVGRMVVDARRGGREPGSDRPDPRRDRPPRVTMRPAPGGVRLTF
jgi:hypothetical protein